MSQFEIIRYETPLEYKEFLQLHLIPNEPALFGPALTDDWKARKEWVLPSNETDQGPRFKPNYSFLKSHFAGAQVQVATCHKRHFSDQERTEMKFEEFCQIWETQLESSYYLKDWHFVKAFPDEKAYKVPEVFKDDWLNAYWINSSQDDYRFSYMGGHDTFTPMHSDVYRSYSWSSNICGIKKWTLFPPDQEEYLKDKFGNLVYDIREVDLEKFPRFQQAKKAVLYQRDGETLFVPSGWFHQVENIGATISINHNWCNSNNLYLTYRSLAKDYKDVKGAIDDIKESMSEQEFMAECQHLLLMHSGWNWDTFLSILHYITSEYMTDCDYQPSVQWQIEKVKKVMDSWVSEEGESLVNYFRRDPILLSKYNELQTIIKKSVS